MKTHIQRTILPALLLLATLNLQLSTLFAQGTAFTYQGQLKDGLAPANGSYDLTFSLFGVSSGGGAVGGPVIKLATPVTNGLFTVTLDFGAGQFTSLARWLEIGVRTNGSGTFATLNPRQSLTPAPYAIYAASAGVGGGSPWLLNGANTYYNGGNVGIGTTSPQGPLHIASDAFAVMFLHDTGSDATQAGYVSYRNGSFAETAWVGFGTAGNPDFSIVNARPGGDIVLLPFSGNVGIGTATPAAKLEVHGDIRLGPSGQFRATSSEENLRIIRGRVSKTGAILSGTGFQAFHENATGWSNFTITFNTPFAGTPTVTATTDFVLGDGTTFVMTHGAFTDRVYFRVWDPLDVRMADNNFQFIAIGPR